MNAIRKTVLRAALLVAFAGLLGSCTVNKADLARQVDLRDVDMSKVPDGVYVGSYTIRPPAGAMAGNKSVEVRVTVAGGKYTRIEILKPPALGKSASFVSLFSRVKDTQHLTVDAISSATITSMSILKAIQLAVSAPAAGSSQ
jgi:uncharacterized protein with FMN-binding domain